MADRHCYGFLSGRCPGFWLAQSSLSWLLVCQLLLEATGSDLKNDKTHDNKLPYLRAPLTSTQTPGKDVIAAKPGMPFEINDIGD